MISDVLCGAVGQTDQNLNYYNHLCWGELRERIINPHNDMNALREGSDERRHGG
jgi:hypothetical protein